MSASKISRPIPTDTTPDRSTSADSAKELASRTDPKASDPVEPHWESVISAATD